MYIIKHVEKISPWCTCSSCYNKKINIIKTETTIGTTIDDLEEQFKKILYKEE